MISFGNYHLTNTVPQAFRVLVSTHPQSAFRLDRMREKYVVLEMDMPVQVSLKIFHAGVQAFVARACSVRCGVIDESIRICFKRSPAASCSNIIIRTGFCTVPKFGYRPAYGRRRPHLRASRCRGTAPPLPLHVRDQFVG